MESTDGVVGNLAHSDHPPCHVTIETLFAVRNQSQALVAWYVGFCIAGGRWSLLLWQLFWLLLL